MNVKVEFINVVWDNYQGASGTLVKMERIIKLHPESKLQDVKEMCIDELNRQGYVDSWNKQNFDGHGIVSVVIL